MKKLIFIIMTVMVISSCSTTKEAKSSRVEDRKERNLAEQATIRQSVESKRFIIKLDKLYFSYGGIVNLRPRANYIIIDGEKAIISAGYIGRQYDIRPIIGINMRGKLTEYKMTNDASKHAYSIKLEASNGRSTFDVYLNIGKNGYCSASVSSLRINFVRYSGQIVPINSNQAVPVPGDQMI